MNREKQEVQAFWENAPCGLAYAKGDTASEQFEQHSTERYRLEPYIFDFAQFDQGREKTVLEIGVGLGADHVQWALRNPRLLVGVDLTTAGVLKTRERLTTLKQRTEAFVADAEDLPFANDSFDIVYSWGVLHHSPDTPKAIQEVMRVLKPNGVARLMIYHKSSILAWMLWFRYGALRGLSIEKTCAQYLESPGTHVYTRKEALQMCNGFGEVRIRTHLGVGDLLEGVAGQRHKGKLLEFLKFV